MLVRGILWEGYRPVHKPERYRSLDEFLDKVSENLQGIAPIAPEAAARAGVDLTAVAKAAGCATGVAMITVPPDGQKGIVMSPNANGVWTESEAAVVAGSIGQAPPGSVLVVDCEISVSVAERAAETAGRRGISVILDPSPAARVTEPLLTAAGVVVPNGAEAETLTGIACDDVQSSARAGRRLLERGTNAACIKLGVGGCVSL